MFCPDCGRDSIPPGSDKCGCGYELAEEDAKSIDTERVIERLSNTMDDLDRARENAPEITEDRRCPEDDHLNMAIADAHMKVEEAITMLEGERDPRRTGGIQK